VNKVDQKHRHDRGPTEAQRDERVRLDIDPDEALKKLLGVDEEEDVGADEG
jgi:hypothetical protein